MRKLLSKFISHYGGSSISDLKKFADVTVDAGERKAFLVLAKMKEDGVEFKQVDFLKPFLVYEATKDIDYDRYLKSDVINLRPRQAGRSWVVKQLKKRKETDITKDNFNPWREVEIEGKKYFVRTVEGEFKRAEYPQFEKGLSKWERDFAAPVLIHAIERGLGLLKRQAILKVEQKLKRLNANIDSFKNISKDMLNRCLEDIKKESEERGEKKLLKDLVVGDVFVFFTDPTEIYKVFFKSENSIVVTIEKGYKMISKTLNLVDKGNIPVIRVY